MTLDLQSLFIGLLGIVCAILGWLGRELWAAVQQLKRDLSTLEVRVTREYVPYDRMQDALKPIMDALNEIRTSMNEKADK